MLIYAPTPLHISMIQLLSERDIHELLSAKDAIEVIETALKERAEGRAWSPVKARFDTHDGRGYMRVLPGGLPRWGVAAVKTYLDPTSKGTGGTVVLQLYDMNSGHLLAIMGAERLGQLRTAASCAVAVKYLARKDAQVVGLFGSGKQAGAHLEAFCKVRAIKSAKVYSPTQARRDEFARSMSATLGVDVASKDNPDEVVRGADIVACTTTAREPVFRGQLLEPGALVTSIGSHLPTIREVDDVTVLRSKLVVDSTEQALQNVGNLVLPLAQGLITRDALYAELGDIIIGRKPGRLTDTENILYHCTGLSIYDVAVAYRAWERARERKIGTNFALEDLA